LPVIARAADIEVMAKPRIMEPPSYPFALQQRYGTQNIKVRFLVDEKGDVLFPRVVSGGVPAVNQIVLDAVGRWKFQPATIKGEPIIAMTQIPIIMNKLDLSKVVFETDDLDKMPWPVKRVAPVYPEKLRKSGVRGRVTLIFVVDENGVVINPRVESSTDNAFDWPAVKALKKWRFTPGMKDGRTVKTRMRQPFSFSLR